MQLNEQDKNLLEELDIKYGKDLLASTLLQIANEIDPEKSDDNIVVSPKECVLNYIQFLEGSMIRVREIHWETESDSIHNVANNLLYELSYIEDSVAEQLMGLCGFRIHVGEILPVMPESTSMESLLKEIKTQTLSVLLSVEDDENFIGVVYELEKFSKTLDQTSYKVTLK